MKNGIDSTLPIYSKKILVVEDEIVIAADLEKTLNCLGYSVCCTVTAGEDAVNLAHCDPPDLIVMDIKLGGRLDGIETAEIIQASNKIPIVFLTSHADEEYLERAKYIFPYCFLIKPYTPTQLQTTVKLALDVSHIEEERKRIDDALKGKTEQFEQFFNLGMDLFSIADKEGVFRKLNREWERCLGYSLSEMEGECYTDFVHPDDIEITKKMMRRLFKRDEVTNFVNRFRAGDGSYRWLEWAAQIGEGESVYAVARDITERRDSQEKLRQSEELYRTLLETSPEAVVVTDMGAMPLMINKKALDLYGFESFREVKAERNNTLEGVAEKDRDRLINDMIETYQTGIITQREYLLLKRDNTPFYGEVSFSFFNDGNGMPAGAISIIRDISSRKELEGEREGLIKQLRQALQEIKTLQGFIPLCSNCKKIRDDEGYWQRIEKYIQDRSPVQFTHSVCPDCMNKLYPDLYRILDDE